MPALGSQIGGVIGANAATGAARAGGVEQRKYMRVGIGELRGHVDLAEQALQGGEERALDTLSPFLQAALASNLTPDELGTIRQSLVSEATTTGLSPGEKFQLEEGKKALRGAQTARGLFKSGAGIEAEGRLAQQIGAQSEANRLNLAGQLLNAGTNAGLGLPSTIAGIQQQTGANLANLWQSEGSSLLNAYSGLGAATMANLTNVGALTGQQYKQTGKAIGTGAQMIAQAFGVPPSQGGGMRSLFGS